MRVNLVEGVDFYYNEMGYIVLTEKFHRDRGHCCGNGCLHCPFDYERVPAPRRAELLLARRQQEGEVSATDLKSATD